MSVTIRRARRDDIDFIMQTERGDGYEDFVGRWDRTMHEAELSKPGSAYLIGERDGISHGFAILKDLDDPCGNVLLKRIAVREPGAGFGRAFLRSTMSWVFEGLPCHRLWLDVLMHNDRARHVYRSVGFKEDGVMREAYVLPDGRRVSQMLMSVLRPEWESACAGGAETKRSPMPGA